jgi:MscS family membrane protein
MFDAEFLNREFHGNSVRQYLVAVGIILLGIIFRKFVSKILSRVLFKLLKRYSKDVGVEKFVALLTRPFSLFLTLLVLYLAFVQLQWPPDWNLAPIEQFGVKMSIWRLFLVALCLSFTWILMRIIEFFSLVFLYRAEEASSSKYNTQLIPFVRDLLKLVTAIVSVFFILSAVFEVNVATLVAGLGIGGLAVALAAKESIENLIASFTIFFDKPFVIGDIVQVGTVTGKVEAIGFRSTRIRTADKSFVTVPNKKMIDAELENQSERYERRAYFTIGLMYSTTNEQVKKIIREIKQAIDNHKMVEAGSIVRFSEFGNSSLNILIQYYIKSNDLEIYLSTKEEINFRIMEIVHDNGAVFAFPPMGTLPVKTPTQVS